MLLSEPLVSYRASTASSRGDPEEQGVAAEDWVYGKTRGKHAGLRGTSGLSCNLFGWTQDAMLRLLGSLGGYHARTAERGEETEACG